MAKTQTHISLTMDDPKTLCAAMRTAYDVPGGSDDDAAIRDAAVHLGALTLKRVDRSPDRTQALRCLRESLMWASQAANGSITTGE